MSCLLLPLGCQNIVSLPYPHSILRTPLTRTTTFSRFCSHSLTHPITLSPVCRVLDVGWYLFSYTYTHNLFCICSLHAQPLSLSPSLSLTHAHAHAHAQTPTNTCSITLFYILTHMYTKISTHTLCTRRFQVY